MMTTLLAATIGEYQGRLADVLMLDDAILSKEGLLTQTLAKPGQGGAMITGIEKLAQRFLLELLTGLGSMPYLPERGCLFMLEATRGLWRTAGDVSSSFNSSIMMIKQNLMGDEIESDPYDERFAEAELLYVSLTRDLVTMRIRLTSMAGNDRQIVFPLRVANT